MLRAGLRTIHLGATRRTSPNTRIQLRWASQSETRQENVGGGGGLKGVRAVKGFNKSAHAKYKRRSKNTVPIEDSLQTEPKSSRKETTSTSKGKSTVKRTSSFPEEGIAHGRKPSSKQTRFSPKAKVLYTKTYLHSTYEQPTSAQYGSAVESLAQSLTEQGLIDRVGMVNLSLKHTGGKPMSEFILHVNFGERKWKTAGHGSTSKEAQEAAYLHLLCQLHKTGDLAQILSGVKQYLDPGQTKLRQQANAKKDIIDFAARHDCFPEFSFHKTSRLGLSKKTSFRAHVSVPKLELNGYGRGTSVSSAILAACISSKHAAEARYQETGNGTFLVKDYTSLTTHSAEKFVTFYCRNQQLEVSLKSSSSTKSLTGADWISEVVLSKVSQSDENSLAFMNRALNELADSDAWPAASTGEEDQQRTYKGIAMVSKDDAEAVGYLATAMALKKESSHLWDKFTKEMRRGNGDLLIRLKPINLTLGENTIQLMEDTLQETSAVELETKTHIVPEETRKNRQPRSQQLRSEDIERKSQELSIRLARYEANPGLLDLRRLRMELPMTQYRDKVMKIIKDNDVCIVVGATGSGKTTQVPQLILDDFIREGNGGSCNIICTQPRRIAAVSVARRVAVERNERLRESVGYSVRFDSQPPSFGGSIQYLTSGILLKQMQDETTESLNGISHIVVDEVHERDVNNDFLLVVLKNLLADRRKSGKPAIKVILMSATINTSLFCKYFGSGYPSKKCPHIEVPGRTFPVTSHYLDDIYSELRATYGKTEAVDLYTKESQDYISRELESPSLSTTSQPPSEDPEIETGENRAVIDWDSTGSVAEDGEIDLAINKDDTMTPVGLMGVTIAHLLKTTTEGSILVFLPGLQEIIKLEKQLNNTRPLGIDFANNPNYSVYILHSSLPQMQQDVFSKVDTGKRKIILATNIAETSVTIPDVVYVVDSSKQRESQYDRARRIASLVSVWTAKSNARQRAGRAGRVQHGHYYTMASKARYAAFETSTKPEILRTDLQSLCLQIKSMGITDVRGFFDSAIEPPAPSAVETAMDELQSLKALNEDESLTPLGRYLSAFPLSPPIAKMVVLGAIFRCLDPMLILAASQGSKSPFLRPLDQRKAADLSREKWAFGTGSDQAAFINAFREWRRLRRSGRGSWQPERQFAYANFIHNDTMASIARTADQILDLLRSTGLVHDSPQDGSHGSAQYGSASDNMYSDSHALHVALATAGYHPNIAVRTRGNPRFLRTASENETAIFPYSVAAPKTVDDNPYGRLDMASATPPGTLFTFADKTQADGNGVFLRSVSETYPLAVYLFGGRTTIEGSVITVDDWIPFSVRRRENFLLRKFGAAVDEYLGRTFGRLRSSRDPILQGQSVLDQDKTRAPLIKGIVEALESCAPPVLDSAPGTSALLHGTDNLVWDNALEKIHPPPSSRPKATSKYGDFRENLAEIQGGPSEKQSTFRSTSHHLNRLRHPSITPRNTVLELLQKWKNK